MKITDYYPMWRAGNRYFNILSPSDLVWWPHNCKVYLKGVGVVSSTTGFDLLYVSTQNLEFWGDNPPAIEGYEWEKHRVNWGIRLRSQMNLRFG